MRPGLRPTRCDFHPALELIEPAPDLVAADPPAAHHHARAPAGSRLLQRIRVEQDQVGPVAQRHRAELPSSLDSRAYRATFAVPTRRIWNGVRPASCGHLQLAMQRKARDVEHLRGVRAHEQRRARVGQRLEHLAPQLRSARSARRRHAAAADRACALPLLVHPARDPLRRRVLHLGAAAAICSGVFGRTEVLPQVHCRHVPDAGAPSCGARVARRSPARHGAPDLLRYTCPCGTRSGASSSSLTAPSR